MHSHTHKRADYRFGNLVYDAFNGELVGCLWEKSRSHSSNGSHNSPTGYITIDTFQFQMINQHIVNGGD